MASGLQVFNSSGTLIMDASTITTEYLGTFTANAGSGSFSDGNIGSRNVWVQEISHSDVSNQWGLYIKPVISVSGNTISWSQPSGFSVGESTNVVFAYGAY